MAIYETSKRSSLVVRMVMLMLGSKEGSASSNNKSNGGFDNWSTATAAAGVGLTVFLFMTASYNKNKSSVTSHNNFKDGNKEQSLALPTNKSNADSNDTVAVIYSFCRSVVQTFLESLASISPNIEDDPLLVQARLRALAKAQKEKEQQNDDLTVVKHSGSCQCNAVTFKVRLFLG